MKKRVVSLIIALSLISAPAYVVSYEGGEFDRNEKSTLIVLDALLKEPWDYTMKRPWGQFD